MAATFYEETVACSCHRADSLRRIVASHSSVWVTTDSHRCRSGDAFHRLSRQLVAADESFRRTFLFMLDSCLCTVSCLRRLRMAWRAALRRSRERVIFMVFWSQFSDSRARTFGVVSYELPNKALHRTANCAWGFALEFFLFISQFVAVGELTSEVIRQGIFQ